MLQLLMYIYINILSGLSKEVGLYSFERQLLRSTAK